MKILMVYPAYPKTYWSFHYALSFISRKASLPPLGLLTVASLLPEEWDKKLVDMNVSQLSDRDIKWADYVFISAMVIQKESVKKVVSRCRKNGVKTVAGGPLFTSEYDEFQDIDHLVLDEAEITLPAFLEDLEKGRAQKIYRSREWADVTGTPVPMWELIDMRQYANMNIQYSRGCPFNCDFCNITLLYGRKPRTKNKSQIIEELDSLYLRGWRDAVFFVDDNFIGNKQKLKNEILPAIIEWMEMRKRPFTLFTEASVDLADDEKLMEMMVHAGFNTVFIGIETPNEDSLVECNKYQNRNRDLMASVRKMQRAGLQVQGGFIIGFDNDPVSIFDRLIGFIQESGIVTAMVGLLNAPKGTRLYQRMKKEGRLLNDFLGSNTDFSMNFLPRMNPDLLIKGYRKVINTIYSPKHYYRRVIKFLEEYRPIGREKFRFRFGYLKALLKSMAILGIAERERVYYWKLVFWSLFKRPRLLPLAVQFTIYGFHFRKVFEEY